MPEPLGADHSFVVPAYGVSPFLADCLRSLAGQSVPSRIIVATSTPSDEVADTARAFAAEYVVNPERGGIGADWNFALRAAGTRFVTLAHQDDVYAPAFLARTLAVFARHPEGALCWTGYDEITDAGLPRRSRITRVKAMIRAATVGRREAVAGRRLGLFLSFGNPLPCSSVTFDLAKLPDFAFSRDFASNLDWDAWWRLHRDGRTFLHCAEPLVGRRYNDLTATSRLIRDGRRAREDRQMFEAIWPAPVARALALLYRAGY